MWSSMGFWDRWLGFFDGCWLPWVGPHVPKPKNPTTLLLRNQSLESRNKVCIVEGIKNQGYHICFHILSKYDRHLWKSVLQRILVTWATAVANLDIPWNPEWALTGSLQWHLKLPYMGVSKNRGIPKWMVYEENLLYIMDDLGYHHFRKPPSHWVQ